MNIVLIGAGSAMFTLGVVSDLIQSGLKVRLALVDIDPEALEAAVESSRDKFIQALILDGAASSPDVAVRMADELIAAHRAYLPSMS